MVGSLKRHGLIDGAIRAPQPGAPFAYVTTRKFLETFGFASLRDLPDLERLRAERLMQGGQGENNLIGRSGWPGRSWGSRLTRKRRALQRGGFVEDDPELDAPKVRE